MQARIELLSLNEVRCMHDDEQAGSNKRKMLDRITAYEIAKRNLVSKLAQVRVCLHIACPAKMTR